MMCNVSCSLCTISQDWPIAFFCFTGCLLRTHSFLCLLYLFQHFLGAYLEWEDLAFFFSYCLLIELNWTFFLVLI